DADPAHAARLEHPQHAARLLERLVEMVVARDDGESRIVFRPACRFRRAYSVGALRVRHRVERGQADDDLQPRYGRADAVDHLTHEPRPALERTSIRARTAARAEQLVTEIAVARLEIHELVAARAGTPRRLHEIVSEAIELLVRDHTHTVREPAIEQRVMRAGHRRRPIVDVGTRVAA